MSDFFQLYRKKGVSETLEILNSFKKKEAQQAKFFKTIKENQSYLNSFFRVKKELLKLNLIAYKLDDENEKVIFLTDKGKELHKRIVEIEEIIQTN